MRSPPRSSQKLSHILVVSELLGIGSSRIQPKRQPCPHLLNQQLRPSQPWKKPTCCACRPLASFLRPDSCDLEGPVPTSRNFALNVCQGFLRRKIPAWIPGGKVRQRKIEMSGLPDYYNVHCEVRPFLVTAWLQPPAPNVVGCANLRPLSCSVSSCHCAWPGREKRAR